MVGHVHTGLTGRMAKYDPRTEMSKWVVTGGFVLALISFVTMAFFAMLIVRVHGGSRRSWHLLVAAPSYLDLSKYPSKAVALSVWFRRCGYVVLGSLAVATLVHVLCS
jgi:hypothetical protein